jgi:hypothetical protein
MNETDNRYDVTGIASICKPIDEDEDENKEQNKDIFDKTSNKNLDTDYDCNAEFDIIKYFGMYDIDDDNDDTIDHVDGIDNVDNIDLADTHKPNDIDDKEKERKDIMVDVTNIIRSHVQNLMLFNREFPQLLKLFKKSISPYKHHIILTKDMAPVMKANILGLLNDHEFLSIMASDLHLLDEIFIHLDDRCFLLLISSLTDQIIIPLLLRHKTFLTVDRVKKLKDLGSEFYGLDYYHIIANNIDIITNEKLLESISLIDKNLLPNDDYDKKNVINMLKKFIATPGLDFLRDMMRLYSKKDNILYNGKNFDSIDNIIDTTVKKPIKWLVDVGETIISASTKKFNLK